MKTAPALADRIVDAAALLMVIGGIALFAFARQALTSMGNETLAVPKGVSAVTITDLHVAQSKFGLWMIGVGVLVGVVAAVRHKLRKAI